VKLSAVWSILRKSSCFRHLYSCHLDWPRAKGARAGAASLRANREYRQLGPLKRQVRANQSRATAGVPESPRQLYGYNYGDHAGGAVRLVAQAAQDSCVAINAAVSPRRSGMIGEEAHLAIALAQITARIGLRYPEFFGWFRDTSNASTFWRASSISLLRSISA
jgi:hypothetical protein